MAVKKYLKINTTTGMAEEEAAVDTSAGAGDSGKIVALDATGRINQNQMPTGIGADLKSLEASEALSAGDFVNVFDDAGTIKIRKADATTSGKQADGFVKTSVTLGSNGDVYFEGLNTALTGLTGGARYFLGTTAGGAVTTPPSSAGNVVQYLGRAVSTTELAFEANDGIVLA